MRLYRSARLLMLALFVSLVPLASQAGVFISINFAPPILPVYEQPPCPEPNLIWTPGYWAYGEEGYFWVPGAWVPAPFEGGLWTPGYWGWNNSLYIFHPGYWGYHVGYYGGVNYGGGYQGVGFAGGEWRGHDFAYNTAVMHVNNTVIRNTYVNETIVHNTTIINDRHVAYSGGPGGIQHQPDAQERVAEHEQHTAPTSFQAQHVNTARTNHMSYAKANGGHPTMLAAARPLAVERHEAPAAPRGMANAGSGHNNAPMTANHAPMTNGAPRAETPGVNPGRANAPEYKAPTHPASPEYRAPTQPNTPEYKAPVRPNAPEYRAPARPSAPEYKAPARPNTQEFKAPPPPKAAPHPAEKREPHEK